jgi:hypothetical protein
MGILWFIFTKGGMGDVVASVGFALSPPCPTMFCSLLACLFYFINHIN